MESARTFLWLTFSALCVFLYIEWSNQDTALGYDSNQESTAPRGLEQTLNTADESSESFQENLPSINSGKLVANTNNLKDKSETSTISNNVLSITVDSKGADIIAAKLLKYYPSKNKKDNKIDLMYVNDPLYEFHRLQSGLLSASGEPSPTHIENYSLSSRGRNKLSFVWFSDDGTKVTKTLKLNPDSYLVEVTFLIENMSEQTESYVPYYQLVKDNVEVERSMFDVESYSFDGGIIYDGDSYEKQYADDLIDAPYKKTHTNGWFANIRHHFVVAVLPPMGVEHRYESEHDEAANLNKVTAISNSNITAGPRQRTEAGFGIFIGPKLQSELTKARDGLEVSVDYGRLSFLAKPMFWALNKSHSFLGNWGLAIIFVTLMIKVIFYRLQESSSRSMAKMRELAPRLKALNERFGDDKTALGQAQMELYKREKVNPMAGCLPLLIQIPFFIAFYWVLLESVEIRQAPFYLWLDDLSSRDPYFVLPLLMGVVMFFQQKANPAPADPVQEKVFMFMPIMFTLLFAWFPSGLVLYWVTNSLLQFAQQWNVNRKMAAEKN
ncbi:MAG: membrane protein insertase YidC [Gammaproteobacteria bacterium]|nr:membrane protein insertase YidC [Gammaproteobacteria bacterium]|tara:strand:- start:3143 stop:4801 length:1659 start_codon:yes stop_codon:yes gene_type:complete